MSTVVGKAVSAPRLSVNRRTTAVRLPPTGTVTNRSTELSDARRTRNPICEIALGSVALTFTVSLTSIRNPTLSVTEGGVTSFAAESTDTTTVPLVDRRPLESSAKPVIVNVPVVATTSTVST